MNQCLGRVVDWMQANKMRFSSDKIEKLCEPVLQGVNTQPNKVDLQFSVQCAVLYAFENGPETSLSLKQRS